MQCIQQQSKRFLKVKAKLPNTLPNPIFKEADATRVFKKYKVTGLRSRPLPNLAEIKEVAVPYAENDYISLKNSLASLLGDDIVNRDLPANLLINKSLLLDNRLEKPFQDYSKTEKIEQLGNNEHFNILGDSYSKYLSRKYSENKLNLNKLHPQESIAVLGFLYLTNYKNNNLESFEKKLIEKLI